MERLSAFSRVPQSHNAVPSPHAIGTVTNLAARLCDEARGGQILISQRVYAEVEEQVEAEPLGEFTMRGFHRPITAFNVLRPKVETRSQA